MKNKNTAMLKRIVAAMCSVAMAVSVLPANGLLLKSQAKAELNPLPAKSIRPQNPTFTVDGLLDFTPGERADDKYVKSVVPLAEKKQAQKVNSYANTEAQTVALTIMQREDDVAHGYAFTYWQYLDMLSKWGPHDGEGRIKLPFGEETDAAHRNGTISTGDLFIANDVNQSLFLTQNSDGTFPVVDKLIEIEQYYGFDGWFYNFEHTLSANQAATLRTKQLLQYHQSVKPEGSTTMWYDDMTNNGSLAYVDHLNSNNSDWLQWGDVKTNDYYFTNYNWTASEVQTSVDTANSIGRSPYDVFHTLQCQRDGGYLDTYFAGKDKALFGEGTAKTSVGFFVPNVTLNISKTPEDFLMHDNRFWVGYTGDPSKPDTRDKDDNGQPLWKGISTYINARTVIEGDTFLTNFGNGQGYDFYVDGEKSKGREWSYYAIQDILPTWQWISDTESDKEFKGNLDLSDAYYGGTSMKAEGDLEAGKPVTMRLYATNLDTTENSQITVTHKTAAEKSNMKVGLKFTNTLEDEVTGDYVLFDVTEGQTGEWTTSKIDIPDEYAGRYIREIGLVFESDQDENNFKVNIGELGIIDGSKTSFDAAVENAQIEEVSYPSPVCASLKVAFDKVQDADEYQVFKVNQDGTKSYLASSPNNAIYVTKMDRGGDDVSTIEIIPVDKQGNRGNATQLRMTWTVPADEDLYPGESEEEQVNLALDNPNVVASKEIKTEPGKNAVDGTAKNNSKWCAESATRATLTVSYDEPITVQRYYLIHAGHPDAGEGQNYNTKAWTILASDDGSNWTEIHKVTNNVDYETNVNLDEPVTAKYFRIRMDAPAQSGSVVRLYEFQLYEKPYTFRTDLIEEEDVQILENADGTRNVVVDNLYQGDTVRLYNDSEGTDLIAEQPVASGTTAVFENVNLSENGGKLFFARQKSGRRESLLRGKRYLALDAAVTQLRAADIVAVNNAGYTDTLTVNNLSEGDVVKVYRNADDVNPMGTSKMVTSTATSATIKDLHFDKDDSFVYVTVTAPYQKESARVKVATAAEVRSENYKQDFEGADKGLWSNAYGTSDIKITDSLTYTSFHNFSNEAIVIDRNAPSKYDATLSMDVTLGTGSANMTFYVKYLDRYNNLAIQVAPNGTWTYIIRQNDKNVANGTIATGVPLAAGTTYALEIRNVDGEFVLRLDGEEFGSFENEMAAQMYGTFAFKSASGTRAVTLDNLSFEDNIPVIPPVVTGAPESGATRNAVTLTADKQVTWTVNGQTVDKASTSITMRDEGVYTVVATDENGTSTEEITFAIDRTAPVLDATTEHYGITNQDVTFTANEEVTFYNGTEVIAEGTELVLTESGVYNIRAIDKAGNYTPFYRVTIMKDAPVLTGAPENVTRSNVAIRSNVKVLYTVNGVEADDYAYGLRITEEGAYTIKATDMAGNESEVSFEIDRTKPVFTASVPSGQATGKDITLTADETVNFVIDGETVATGTEYTVTESTVVYVYDLAGNYGGAYRANIDKTAPVLSAVIEGTNKAVENGATVSQSVTVKASKASYFVINDEEPTQRANFVKLKAKGTFTVKAVDMLGNESEAFTVTIK